MIFFGPQQSMYSILDQYQMVNAHECNLFCGCHTSQRSLNNTVSDAVELASITPIESEHINPVTAEEEPIREDPNGLPYWFDCDCPVCTAIRYSKAYAEPATPRANAKRQYKYRCLACGKTYLSIETMNQHAMTYHPEPIREALLHGLSDKSAAQSVVS